MPNIAPYGVSAKQGSGFVPVGRAWAGGASVRKMFVSTATGWRLVWADVVEAPVSASAAWDGVRVVVTVTVPEHFAGDSVVLISPSGDEVHSKPVSGAGTVTLLDSSPLPVLGAWSVRGRLAGVLSGSVVSTNVIDLRMDCGSVSLSRSGSSITASWSPANPGPPYSWHIYHNGSYVGQVAGISTSAQVAGAVGQVNTISVVGHLSGQNSTVSSSAAISVPAAAPGSASATAAGVPSQGCAASGSVACSWGHASGARTGYRVEVSVNGGGWSHWFTSGVVSATYGAPLGATFRFRVRTESAGGPSGWVYSNQVTTPTSQNPGVPSVSLIPTSFVGQLVASWSAPAGCVDGYDVQWSSNGSVWSTGGDTVSPAHHTFSGSSGARWCRVRARSQGRVSGWSTRSAIPTWDTTPPGNANVQGWYPHGAYGRMTLFAQLPSDYDFQAYQVQWQINNGGAIYTAKDWTNAVRLQSIQQQVTNGGSPGTVYTVRVNVRDTTGNIRYGPWHTYTLKATPVFVHAQWTNSWRNTNGGQWNAANNNRVYQGYYTNAGYNARGVISYGFNVVRNALRATGSAAYANGGRVTITGCRVYLARHGCGINAADMVRVWCSSITHNPGNATGAAAPPIAYARNVGTLTYGQAAEFWLDTVQFERLADGYEHALCVHDEDGKPYLCLQSLAENGTQGRLRFDHWG